MAGRTLTGPILCAASQSSSKICCRREYNTEARKIGYKIGYYYRKMGKGVRAGYDWLMPFKSEKPVTKAEKARALKGRINRLIIVPSFFVFLGAIVWLEMKTKMDMTKGSTRETRLENFQHALDRPDHDSNTLLREVSSRNRQEKLTREEVIEACSQDKRGISRLGTIVRI